MRSNTARMPQLASRAWRSGCRRRVSALASAAALAMCAALPLAMAAEPVYPPWQHGENNPALNKGLEFTVPDADNLADFHGNLNDPLLVLYYGGNSFFTMAPLMKAFEAKYPQYKGRVYRRSRPGMGQLVVRGQRGVRPGASPRLGATAR